MLIITLGSVTTKVDIYPGVPHGFGLFPELSATQKYGQDMLNALRWLIELD